MEQCYRHFDYKEDLGRVEHWCILGAALERFDARAYHEPQQSAMTSAPSSNRACSFPAHGFPMFFMPRHAPSASLLLWEPYITRSAHTDQTAGTGVSRCLGP